MLQVLNAASVLLERVVRKSELVEYLRIVLVYRKCALQVLDTLLVAAELEEALRAVHEEAHVVAVLRDREIHVAESNLIVLQRMVAATKPIVNTWVVI